MKVLIACEFSGIVRDAFIKKGHKATSCDLLPTEKTGPHIQDDVLNHLNDDWDLMIAHPPCTYLTVTGNKWFKPEFENRFPHRREQRLDAIDFFMKLINSSIEKIAIENPIGIMSTKYRKPNQIIQPYYFGIPERKSTCLWLKNLPILKPTKIVEPIIIKYKNGKGTDDKWHVDTMRLPPIERMKERSRTFQGIADAMAEQWGNIPYSSK